MAHSVFFGREEDPMLPAILVPLDGSKCAECALPVAAMLAERTSGALHLVHVHVPFEPIGKCPETINISIADVERERRDMEQAYLARLQAPLQFGKRFTVTRALREGRVAETLISYAEQFAIGLIVMTTHGCGPVVRVWLGSVVEGLLRQSTVPLLLVRPNPNGEPSAPIAGFRHVLIPLDGSTRAEDVITPALSLADASATFTLVRVVVPPHLLAALLRRDAHTLEDEEIQRRRDTACDELATAAARVFPAGTRVETRVITADNPAAAIFEQARMSGCDLLAISPRGRSGRRQVLMGSVADKLLRISECPVLVVPERRQAVGTEPGITLSR
jgi:nucleotide-binding universal stress UspA family protein